MPQFKFTAIDETGKKTEGRQSAENSEALTQLLRKRRLIPINVEQADRGGIFGGLELHSTKRLKEVDLVLFMRNLSTYVDAALPLDKALAMIADIKGNSAVSDLAKRILSHVNDGGTLSGGLATEGNLFQPQYVALIQAGEAGGKLKSAMSDVSNQMEGALVLRQKLANALQYPVLVLMVALVTITILVSVVLPQFAPIFEQAGDSIPPLTSAMLSLSQFMRSYGWLLLLGLVLAALMVIRDVRSEHGRQRWDRWLLAIPLIGEMIGKADAVRFCRTLGVLLTSGVSTLRAYDLSLATISNRHLSKKMGPVRGKIERGEGIALPVATADVFPAIVAQMTQAGEQSGKIQSMLVKVSEIQENELSRQIDQFMKMLVPAITIALGVVVALICGSILSAILSIYDIPM
ncbi:type II secretion system F family protein [Thalassospira sp.]|uniref:type II secretion system F family protein n=1 Tax=Thalassospira sp. TaxID=1912094 RepID=UPI0032ED1B86